MEKQYQHYVPPLRCCTVFVGVRGTRSPRNLSRLYGFSDRGSAIGPFRPSFDGSSLVYLCPAQISRAGSRSSSTRRPPIWFWPYAGFRSLTQLAGCWVVRHTCRRDVSTSGRGVSCGIVCSTAKRVAHFLNSGYHNTGRLAFREMVCRRFSKSDHIKIDTQHAVYATRLCWTTIAQSQWAKQSTRQNSR